MEDYVGSGLVQAPNAVKGGLLASCVYTIK